MEDNITSNLIKKESKKDMIISQDELNGVKHVRQTNDFYVSQEIISKNIHSLNYYH